MQTQSITVKREVACSAAEIYRAFVNSTGLREWFCDSAQTQAKVGGRIYCGWNDGTALIGKFVRLVPGKKIVLDIRADQGDTDRSRVTIALSERLSQRVGQTRVTLTDSSDGRDWIAIKHAVEHGWNDSLDNLKSVLERGIDLRLSQKPMLGISLATENHESVRRGKGILVDGVLDGLSAQQAGLQKGDLITALDGQKTGDWAALDQALKQHRAGDVVMVAFVREGVKQRAKMTLASRPLPEHPISAAALAQAVQGLYDKNDKALKTLFKGVTEARAAQAPAVGEWNVKQVLAHLILNERYVHWWLGTLIGSQEPSQDEWEGNISPTIDALVEAQGTLKTLFNTLLMDRRTTVALLRHLPSEIVARKGSFTRIATNMLDGWGLHGDEHLEQIKTALG